MYFDVANTALLVVIGKRFFYNPTPVSRRNQQVEVETKSWGWKSEYVVSTPTECFGDGHCRRLEYSTIDRAIRDVI